MSEKEDFIRNRIKTEAGIAEAFQKDEVGEAKNKVDKLFLQVKEGMKISAEYEAGSTWQVVLCQKWIAKKIKDELSEEIEESTQEIEDWISDTLIAAVSFTDFEEKIEEMKKELIRSNKEAK